MISVRLPIQILPTCQLVDGKFLLCQLLHPVPGLVDPSARLRLFGLLQTPDIQFGPLPPTVFWIQLLVNCLRLVGVWWASSVSAMPALALPQRVPLSPLKIFLPKTVTPIGPPIGTVALAIPQAVAFLNGHAPTVLSKWWLLMLTHCAIDGMLIAPVSMRVMAIPVCKLLFQFWKMSAVWMKRKFFGSAPFVKWELVRRLAHRSVSRLYTRLAVPIAPRDIPKCP